MEKDTFQEKELKRGHRAFLMIKGDLTQKVITGKGSAILEDRKTGKDICRWLKNGLKEYASETCEEIIEVLNAKVVNGLTKEELTKLYGSKHGEWLNNLTKGDLEKHMAIYNGEKGPLILAIVKVDGVASNEEAEERLIKIRDTFREDWHNYLGKKEIKLDGGSTLWLSGVHVGNYDEAKFLLNKHGLIPQ